MFSLVKIYPMKVSICWILEGSSIGLFLGFIYFKFGQLFYLSYFTIWRFQNKQKSA